MVVDPGNLMAHSVNEGSGYNHCEQIVGLLEVILKDFKLLKKLNHLVNGQLGFKDFLVQFKLFAQLAGWHEEIMVLELRVCLTGVAVVVLIDLQPHERTHYPSLVKALLNRFQT